MNTADQIERTIEKLHITTRAETDTRILDDAFAALEKSAQQQPPHLGAGARRRALRIKIAELAAIAAVVLVVFALFFGIPALKAVDLGEIYEALGKVENICITTFQPPANEPIQTEWVSKTMNIDMIRFGERFVLLDIPNKVQKTKRLSSESIKIETPSKELLAKFENGIAPNFGLLTFPDYKDVPQGAQWNRVEGTRVAAIVPGTEVYDLIWTTQIPVVKFHKWRVFVDAHTKLPKRAEHYAKLKPEDQYQLETSELITYPSEDEIQAVIRRTFGPAASPPGEPEYRGTPQPRPTGRKK